MGGIPRDTRPDSTIALARDPYRYIGETCRRLGSDLFETRVMLRPTICMTGPEAARLFYDPGRFVRRGAMPGRIKKTLLGQGGVQGLDGEAHRHRKAMFMSLMTRGRIAALMELAGAWWQEYADQWALMEQVVLYDELPGLLTRAVCAWAGVPLPAGDAGRRTRELTALFDAAGTVGPRHWWARLARNRADRWIAGVIARVRAGELKPPEDSAAHVIAWHRELDGRLLPPRTAAVELLNVLRPTVAVAVYIVFVAHALHEHRECRERIAGGGAAEGYDELFSQEVRRFYPFFPSVIARVAQGFEWHGCRFPAGRRVILDLYGTNHDPRAWDSPEEFRPERFLAWNRSPFNFVPQGGGDHSEHHRCPGEWIAIELMKQAAGLLARRLTYDVPEQDLRIDYGRLPALPRSRFVIRNVRSKTPGQEGGASAGAAPQGGRT